MNLYPAIRASMSNWYYYVVKMTMRELADNVKFAAEVYEDRTLDEAIQRVLNEKRVKQQIVTYLQRQPDRFFSSVVVAALKGNPKFYPVQISDDERFEIFRDDRRLNETFGVLAFDGSQDYYALDGQHRLAAIKTLLDPRSDYFNNAPEGFPDDEMSVIVVVQKAQESDDRFLRRYRRLFSHLNRYAKPMDQATNIIMDEDDTFAILTRQLTSIFHEALLCERLDLVRPFLRE
jgi:DNA sulfur modification protein DndB